jgi:hypothetical protein
MPIVVISGNMRGISTTTAINVDESKIPLAVHHAQVFLEVPLHAHSSGTRGSLRVLKKSGLVGDIDVAIFFFALTASSAAEGSWGAALP